MSKVASKNSATNTGYKVTNWATYNESLVSRGDISVWFDEELVENWRHGNEKSKVGRPYLYSNAAILFGLILKVMFQLPYRQTEGLLRALVKLSDLEIPVPDYTSMAKRANSLDVKIDPGEAKGPIHLVVDSTGLKVYGEGEWKVRKHGKDKRRVWRKIHLAVDPDTHIIHAHATTENDVHDCELVCELLDQVEAQVKSFRGDGAYDTFSVYDRLSKDKIDPIIPPRSNARATTDEFDESTDSDPHPRDCAVWAIENAGLKEWKKDTNYHKRSNAETAMFRLKKAFGDRLSSRTFQRQVKEVAVRCKILNCFVAIGMPLSVWS